MSYRREKINHLFVEEIGSIFLREIEFPSGILVSITRAETTDDFKDAKVLVSVLPFDKAKQVLEILIKNTYYIQKILNRKLRMKPVPKIFFKIDPSIEKASKVERLLGNQ